MRISFKGRSRICGFCFFSRKSDHRINRHLV